MAFGAISVNAPPLIVRLLRVYSSILLASPKQSAHLLLKVSRNAVVLPDCRALLYSST